MTLRFQSFSSLVEQRKASKKSVKALIWVISVWGFVAMSLNPFSVSATLANNSRVSSEHEKTAQKAKSFPRKTSPDAVKQFDISPQLLESALSQFVYQSGVQVVFTSEDVSAVETSGVTGNYSAEQALEILLEETGLEAQLNGPELITVKRASKSAGIVLPTVTVDGSWLGPPTPETIRTYSGSRSVVTEQQLHKNGTLNLEDALRSIPNVTILDETGVGILPNIGIRGLSPFRSERIQILQDGYPIAIGPYSNIGLSLFPITMQSIETIDVVRGGAAVHYGPNNVGGVLNFMTRPIPAELSMSLGERITIAEKTGNVLTDTYFRVGGFVTDSLGLQLQVNPLRGNGYRDHSYTEVDNIILDAEFVPNDTHQFKTQLQYYDVEAELPGSLSPAAYAQDRTQSQRPLDSFDAMMYRGTFTYTFTPDNDTEFQWRNFAHKADRTFFFGQNLSGVGNVFDPAIPSTHLADSPRLFTVVGTEPRITRRFGRHTIILGGRYVREDVDFDVNRLQLSTGMRSVARDWTFGLDAFALYLSDSIHFLDDRLTVTPGLRYEHVDVGFENQLTGVLDSNLAAEFLPGITIGYQATDRLFLFTNAQRSLVPVQTAQVTRDGDVANETAWNYELGGRFQLNPDFNTSLTLFGIDYRDQIQFNRTTARFENLGKTLHYGLETTADWKVTKRANIKLAYTYLETEQRSGANKGKELPNAPHHHLSLKGDYSYKDWAFSLNGLYVSSSFSDAANTGPETVNGSAGKQPSYILVNGRIGHDFKIDDFKINLGLSINNMFDEDYYFRGVDVSPVGRLPTPGRSYILGMEFNY